RRPHRFGAQGAGLEVGSRCRLYSTCAPIVATPDAFADAGDATRLAGACFLPAMARWLGRADVQDLEITDHEGKCRNRNSRALFRRANANELCDDQARR